MTVHLLSTTPFFEFIYGKLVEFSYNTRETLFPISREKSLLLDVFGKIDDELHQTAPDLTVIAGHIKFSLGYCLRAYDRQLQSQPIINNDILDRFEKLCDDYYNSGFPRHRVEKINSASQQATYTIFIRDSCILAACIP